DDEFDVAVERVAPAAAARGADPDQGASRDELGVGKRVRKSFVLAVRVDRDLERPARLSAIDTPAGQDRAIGDRHEIAIGQHPDDLLVPEPAAELAGTA